MKLNATNKSTLKSIAIVFAIICVLQFLRTSYYSPVDIETTNEESLFNLEFKEECLGEYYSDSRGGVCGGQKLVVAQSSYKMK